MTVDAQSLKKGSARIVQTDLEASQYDYAEGATRIRFPNSVEPVNIEVRF